MIYLQTDAPINPGNSGGPARGRGGPHGGPQHHDPAQGGGSEGHRLRGPEQHRAGRSSQQLAASGRVRRGWIGARAQSVTPTLAEGLSLPSTAGVIVADVMPDGARGAWPACASATSC